MKAINRTLAVVVCGSSLIEGCATALQTREPHPAAGFPSSESFYPADAILWAQEGTPVVHYCVDPSGHLSTQPTIAVSSGDDDLDAAALQVAQAGDGHYAPAFESNKAIAGCARFKVNFFLRDDPSFPTLSRRSKQLTNEWRPEARSLQKELQLAQRAPNLDTFVPGDPQQLTQLRNFLATATPLVEKYQTFLTDYVAKMDDLGRADDVSAAERTAFSKYWQKSRIRLTQLRAELLEMQALLGTVKDLADSVESGRSYSANALIARARAQHAVLQANHVKTEGPPPGPQGAGPGTAPQLATQGPMGRASIAGVEYMAASGPVVALPKQLTSTKEVSDFCPYPPKAQRYAVEGTTLLRLQIDEVGTVSSATVERSSGNDELDTAAATCLTKLRFQPAALSGVPVAAVIPYGFVWNFDWGSTDPNRCNELKAAATAHAHPPSSQSAHPVAVVCTCWEESGKAGKPEIVESSGSARLDEGALKLAAAGGVGRPRPPGHPGCFAYRTQFELKN